MLCQNRFPWSSRFQYLGTINFQNAKNQKRNPLNGKGRLEISSDLKQNVKDSPMIIAVK